MTAITDATTVIETLIGRTLTGAELGRIGDRFAAADPHSLFAPVDPMNPTNEEKAQLILDTFATWGRQVVREVARIEAEAANDTTVAAAIAAAEADLT